MREVSKGEIISRLYNGIWGMGLKGFKVELIGLRSGISNDMIAEPLLVILKLYYRSQW